MKKTSSISFLLGGAMLCLLWQPMPESGFLYKIKDGCIITRVQGFFRSSQVEGTSLRSIDGDYHRFVSWASISCANALDGEPTGICFFDDDGDFSGFLPLSGEVLGLVESIYADHSAIELNFSDVDTGKTMSFTPQDADIPWPHRGCDMSVKR